MQIPDVDDLSPLVGDPAIFEENRRLFGLARAGELAQLVFLEVLPEKVPVARPQLVAPIGRQLPAFLVGTAAFGVGHQQGLAGFEFDPGQIAAVFPDPVLREIDVFAVVGEIEIDRRPGQPGEGIGHDPLEA